MGAFMKDAYLTFKASDDAQIRSLAVEGWAKLLLNDVSHNEKV